MLEIGNGALTQQEEEAHMAIWCLLSSPLLAGNNLTAASPAVIKILTAPGPLRYVVVLCIRILCAIEKVENPDHRFGNQLRWQFQSHFSYAFLIVSSAFIWTLVAAAASTRTRSRCRAGSAATVSALAAESGRPMQSQSLAGRPHYCCSTAMPRPPSTPPARTTNALLRQLLY